MNSRLLILMCGMITTIAMAAAAKTLITFDNGTPGSGLAKSWKKGSSSYDFTLDLNVEIGGVKLTQDAVKSSLESKLGDSNGVKVTPMGSDTVTVSYTGDENAFLDAVSKTKIRGSQGTEVAMESTVSQGGIRAKTAEREPIDGEVKGDVLNVAGDVVTLRVTNSSAKSTALGIKPGDKVQIKAPGFSGEAHTKIFFMPGTKNGDVWSSTNVKNQ